MIQENHTKIDQSIERIINILYNQNTFKYDGFIDITINKINTSFEDLKKYILMMNDDYIIEIEIMTAYIKLLIYNENTNKENQIYLQYSQTLNPYIILHVIFYDYLNANSLNNQLQINPLSNLGFIYIGPDHVTSDNLHPLIQSKNITIAGYGALLTKLGKLPEVNITEYLSLIMDNQKSRSNATMIDHEIEELLNSETYMETNYNIAILLAKQEKIYKMIKCNNISHNGSSTYRKNLKILKEIEINRTWRDSIKFDI